MSRLKQTLNLWLPVTFWCAIIFYVSSIPSLRGPWENWDLLLRKAAHVVEYMVLSFLVLRALEGKHRSPSSHGFWMSAAFFFSVLYAASDEFHQSYVPGRMASWKDVAVDSAGCGLGIFLRRFFR